MISAKSLTPMMCRSFLSWCSVLCVAGLLACQSEPPSDQAATVTRELDQSRSNAVKNTPSRITPDGETTVATASTQATSASTQPLYRQLPQGQAVPKGMAFVPGGEVEIGSAQGLPREQPVHEEQVPGFFMNKHPVTVAEFRAFVKATGYRTQAEAYGDAAVFDLQLRQWELRPGAYWAYPQGPSQPAAPDDHPVTQVSWQDAQAYCEWAGLRLPTEREWEHAARSGHNQRDRYPWGESITDEQGRYQANIWQGTFPAINTGEDGYLYTSPVGTFGANRLGLTDLSGNVWEWCQDWYQSYDPNRPGLVQTAEPERVMRGGSFLCDPSYCHGYRVSGRSGSTPETGLFHVGFRPVKSIAWQE
jgi:sulfatase modifying factor 1